MKSRTTFTRTDLFVGLCCAVFVFANLGAIGSGGRRRAKQAVCLSNLKKWGVAWKSYTDDHEGYLPPRGGGDPWGETMGGWPGAVHSYYENPKLLFCPDATKAWDEGGCYPHAAWVDYDGGRRVAASYCANFWVANENEPEFWRTPATKKAGDIPILIDGNWKDTEPEPTDEPFQAREDMVWMGWTPNANEMRRVCIDRHGAYVNACFLDFSVRRIGLKHLWRTWWHKQWDMNHPLPVWPQWLANCEDPAW
ncbi:MAG: hypothetical protein ACYS21_02170 [Planctomycetota bacterium]|jgi:prepilin-type processing-associated H-X9-DG protein